LRPVSVAVAVFDLSLSRGRVHHTLNSRNRCAVTGGQ